MWCDTPYALSPQKGVLMNEKEILDRVYSLKNNQRRQILFTGGEPLEGDKKSLVKKLVKKLSKTNSGLWRQIRIETNGKEDISGLPNAVFSIDFKLPGSGMTQYMLEKNFKYIAKRKNPLDEVKFVVRNREDFDYSLSVIYRFALEQHNIVYSPVHSELPATELANWILKEGTMYSRLSLQLHKILWGNKRGV